MQVSEVRISFKSLIFSIDFSVRLNDLLSIWTAFQRLIVRDESLGMNLLSHEAMPKNLLTSFDVFGKE